MTFLAAASQLSMDARITVLPTGWKFAILLVVVIELMATGYFLKRWWVETHDALPLPAALVMLFTMMALYLFVASALYWYSSMQDRGSLLFWLFVFLVPLCYQYAMNVVNSLAWQSTCRISPMGVHIPDPPKVIEARKNLREGKVATAVELYTEHFGHRLAALVEAARWLKLEDHFHEAATLYEEIVEYNTDDRIIWSEAVYSLGKIYETQLGESKKAMALYRRLLDEAPDSRFCHLAGGDLARMQVMDTDFFASLDGNSGDIPSRDPFYLERMALLRRHAGETASPIPSEDKPENAAANVSRPQKAQANKPRKVGVAKRTASPQKKTKTVKPSSAKRTTKRKTNTGSTGSKTGKEAASAPRKRKASGPLPQDSTET